MIDIIYILQCKNKKYFIGCCPKSKLVSTLRKHRDGKTSHAWTRKYNALTCLRAIERSYHNQETIETEKAMKVWGIHNVRGGEYSKLLLTPHQRRHIQRKFKWDRKACWKCGRTGHFSGACTQTTYVDGSEMSDAEDNDDSLESNDNQYTYSVKEVDNRPTPGMTWHHIPRGT
jgi:predicted GIY-YIG superfamily endonuclease